MKNGQRLTGGEAWVRFHGAAEFCTDEAADRESAESRLAERDLWRAKGRQPERSTAWYVPASSCDFPQCFRRFLYDFKARRAAKLLDKFRLHAPSGMESIT
jgi:hypothetical protein